MDGTAEDEGLVGVSVYWRSSSRLRTVIDSGVRLEEVGSLPHMLNG